MTALSSTLIPRQSRAAAQGFTLLEVMLAVSIISMMGGLIWGAFGPFLQSKEVVEAEAEHYRMLQGSLDRMSREISMAFVSNDFDRLRYRDKTDMPTFFTGEADHLMFTSFAHQRRYRDAKESDQAIYEYKIGNDPDDSSYKQVLIRREKTILDEEFDRGGSVEVLSDDAKKVTFSYYDDQKKEWEEEWDTRKDRNNLPERVKITVTTNDETGKEVSYSTQTKIFLRVGLQH